MKTLMPRRKALLLALLLVCALVVVGCGASTTTTGSAGGDTATTASATPTPTTAASPGESGGASIGKAIQVGCIYPLTGAAAEYGLAQKAGHDFAVKEINASGGINGCEFKIVYEDGRAVPKDTVSAFNKLTTVDQVQAIFIGWSSPTLASAPIADEKKIVLVNCAAASPRLDKAGQFLLNFCNLQSYEVKILCGYAYNEKGNRNMALIYENNDLGLGIKESVEKEFAALGGKIVAAESCEAGAIDFRTQLSKIKAANPDALYVATAGKDTALIVKQARELGIDAQLYSYYAFEFGSDLMGIAGDAIEGAIYTSSTKALPAEFVEKWKSESGKEPIFIQASCYDGTMMLAKAIGEAVAKGDKITGEAIMTGIKAMGSYEGVTGHFVIQQDGSVQKSMAIKMVTKGTFETIKIVEPETK